MLWKNNCVYLWGKEFVDILEFYPEHIWLLKAYMKELLSIYTSNYSQSLIPLCCYKIFQTCAGSPARSQCPRPRPPCPSSRALSSLPTQPRWLLISIAWPGSRSPLPGAASVSRGTDVREFINWEPRNNGIIPPREGTLPPRLSEASL